MTRARVTREGRKPLTTLLSFLLFGVYLVSCMMLVFIGLRAYRHAQDMSLHADNARLSLNYVANKVRAEDRAGAISIETRNGLETLVIRYADDDAFETRIYYTGGALYEMFLLKDADIEPESGTRLAEIRDFSLQMTNARTLLIRATDAWGDARQLTVYLRAGEEAMNP